MKWLHSPARSLREWEALGLNQGRSRTKVYDVAEAYTEDSALADAVVDRKTTDLAFQL